MTDINELQARISKHGITRPNRYQIVFASPPDLLPLIGREMQERLVVQCEVAELPGKSFSTAEQRIYGPLRKYPYVATYTSAIDITFRVGTDFKERSIFDAWQNKAIMDPKSNMFNWASRYQQDILIYQFDHEDKPLYSVKILEAYPEAIHAIALSAESGNSYNKQTITFAYHRWEVNEEESPLTLQSTTSTKKAENGFVETVLQRAGYAFFDQLPLITGSGGTLFGSML